MFIHAGYRAFWPVIFLMPWFLLGGAYLLESVLQRRSRTLRLARANHGSGKP